jgi:hypothetical protein
MFADIEVFHTTAAQRASAHVIVTNIVLFNFHGSMHHV